MYRKTLFILGGILVLLAVVTVFVVSRDGKQSVPNEVAFEENTITYTSTKTNDTITVRYQSSGAILDGVGYQGVSFVPVEAASGAKYESKETNLTLWSKGNEIILTRGRQELFIGIDANQATIDAERWESDRVPQTPDPSPSQATTSAKVSPEETEVSTSTQRIEE